MIPQDGETRHKLKEEFSREFRDLVRKYSPDYDVQWVGELQDLTSCFSPHIWNCNRTPDKPVEEKGICMLCGKPLPKGEEMFKYHGYSGDCPK